ncbi:class II aldolase/adducin family protein [Roseicitreum antarcticum]|uniref:class II aldolase/adducin family protein n=1 Tax=Roseicitreum antarcticum TaxID=564137 RepID=UPI000B826992|nr:class II aldolase/adducin family protein [Roseicitreum antarcticum]
MTPNCWNDSEAASWQQQAGSDPADRDLALRIYTSRLIGGDPDLVLHGGGNTSVKTRRRLPGGAVTGGVSTREGSAPDAAVANTEAEAGGTFADVLHVKGSGWDLATIEGPGLPGVHLDAIRSGGRAGRLSDPDMVALLRANLLDPSAPNPSLETLLHGFLPAKFVDHSHATAVLVLVNQPDAAAICRELYGDRLAVVPYVMPGYDLSIAADQIALAHPDCEGLWLVNHGLFTFGATARESYDRMIDFVNLAETHLAERGVTLYPGDDHPLEGAFPDPFLDRLRDRVQAAGPAFAAGAVLDARDGASIRAFLARNDLRAAAHRGTVTPDHVIRLKPFPLFLDGTETDADIDRALHAYALKYIAYFETCAASATEPKVMLDTLPRVVHVRSLGLIGIGKTKAEAGIVADLAAQTVRVIHAAETRGRFAPLTQAELFEMEYWSLEQAKLKK